VVRVTENKQQNVSAGLGFSTNTGNRAQLNYDNLNVWGTRFKSAITMKRRNRRARQFLLSDDRARLQRQRGRLVRAQRHFQ